VAERFTKPDLMGAEPVFEGDVDDQEQKEERQRSEPAADIEQRNLSSTAKLGALPDQDPADEKPAQNKEELDAVKTSMPEDGERIAEMTVEHDEAMGTDHHRNGRGPEQIEAEHAAGGVRHRWIERSALDAE
jgi:hypothetical protein